MSWNLVTDFGADPTGVADSTTALQSAFDAIASAPSGGKLDVPEGAFKLTSQVNFNSTKPLWIAGYGQQASQFRLASTSSSLGYLCLTQGATFGDERGAKGTIRLSDLSFYNDVTSSAFSNTNIAVDLTGVNHGSMTNCGIYKGSASQRVNQGVVLNGTNQFVISDCEIYAAVNAVQYQGYCQVCTIRDSHLWTPPGTGVSTAAGVGYRGQTLGCSMKHVIIHDGDRGLLWTQDSNGQQPHLFEAYDVEFNNHTITHAEFDYGVHATLVGCIFSGAAVSVNAPGLVFNTNYQGEATIIGTQFIGVPGHSVILKGASGGYIFSACKFGGGGSYKASANAYDELNVATTVTNVTVIGSHFNTDPNMGVGTSLQPRYAINAPGHNVTQVDNIVAANALYASGSALNV